MKILKPLFFTLLLISCSSNSNDEAGCNFLLDVGVNFTIDLSLPQYSQLNFAGNSIYIANQGNAGVIIATTGTSFYAWDAADPNHVLSSCSVIRPDGLFGDCSCEDENSYNFVTGKANNNAELRCSLRNYRVEKSGNILTIFN